MMKTPTFPLVSICIPIYNGEAFLAEALASVKTQTYPNLEVVVSDDRSSDASLALVEKFQQEVDLPVRIFTHEPQGIGANWNHCVAKAKGQYIKFLFQDDVLLPTCVEQMVEAFQQFPELARRHPPAAFPDTGADASTPWTSCRSPTGPCPAAAGSSGHSRA